MKTKLFFVTAFAAASMITASMSTFLNENQDTYTNKNCGDRIYSSIADSSDTTDSGGIIIPPIGN